MQPIPADIFIVYLAELNAACYLSLSSLHSYLVLHFINSVNDIPNNNVCLSLFREILPD